MFKLPEEADALVDQLLNANTELKRWAEFKDHITARLTALHQDGSIPTKFEAHGYTIALQDGRRTFKPDAMGKNTIDKLKGELLEAGHATETIGSPFWTTREIKSK